jgi:hypothetical protein
MLAEKFFLFLETILNHIHADGAPRIKSNSVFVPIKLSRYIDVLTPSRVGNGVRRNQTSRLQ